MRRITPTIALLLTLLPFLSAQSASASDQKTLSVMTRNIYLGADVGVALQLLPDFPAAAQFMWDQMRATNFEKRSRILARELAFYKPDAVGVQEATKWICKKGILSKKKVIFDFLQMLIDETKRQGVGYSLASKDGERAFNTGFRIPAIPRLTVVKDPTLFPSTFEDESASCGFEIADAILIRDDFDGEIVQIGNSEYRDYYTVVPVLMEIYRGYSWLDLDIDGQPIRIVTTHLESLFDEDSVPHSSIQAKQLIADLASTNSPLVVMGDFNADPRDPRGKKEVNPGGQPAENRFCNEQERALSQSKFDSSCNAYWKMIKAGYEDVGPNSLEPKNFTWGLGALLDGPDPAREMVAEEWGNPNGFTERLDYIFIKNGISVNESRLISHQGIKESLLRDCNSTQRRTKCAPSDHAGVFAQLAVSPTNQTSIDQPLPDNQVIPWVKFIFIGLLLLVLSLIIWLPYRFILRPLVILPLQGRMRYRAERGIDINE